MNAMALTLQTQLHWRRVPLTTGPAAAAEARSQVRAAICTWDVPVDGSVAALLTSELVTNALRHEAVVVGAPADAEMGRGLMLVATLSADWGFYPTPAGKAVFFTLAFQPDLAEDDRRGQ